MDGPERPDSTREPRDSDSKSVESPCSVKDTSDDDSAAAVTKATASESHQAAGGATAAGSPKEPVTSTQAGSKVCVVCGDKALSCNFGAITCESCKAFFRRNAFKDFSAKCDKSCDVTVETRSYCKRCRLKKCLAVGMKVNLILSDEQKRKRKQKIFENKLRRMSQADNNKFPLPTVPLGEQDCYITQDSIPAPYMGMGMIQHCGEAVATNTYNSLDVSPSGHAANGVDIPTMPSRLNNIPPQHGNRARLPGIDQITKECVLPPPMAPHTEAVTESLHAYMDPARVQTVDVSAATRDDFHEMPALTPANPHSSFAKRPPPAVNPPIPSYSNPSGVSSRVEPCPIASNLYPASQAAANTFASSHADRNVCDQAVGETLPRATAKRSYRDSNGEVRRTSESSPSEGSASPWNSSCDNHSDQENPNQSSSDISQGGLLSTTLKVIRDAKMFQTKISDLPPPIAKPVFAAAFDDPVLKVNIPSFTEVASQLRNACLAAYDKLPENACPSNPSYVQMFNFGEDTIRQLVILAKNLPPFQALCRDDQICLLKASVLHMMVLKSSMSYDPEIRGWRVFDSGGERNVIPNAVRASQDGRVLMNHYGIIAISVLVASGRDMIIIALLIVLSLLSDSNLKEPDELQERHKVKAAYTLYYEFLRSYVLLKYPEKPSMFQDLTNSLDIVRDFSDTYINAMLKSPLSQLNPLLLEINDIMST